MTPEEKKMVEQLAKDVATIKNYTTNLGGSLEFKNIVQRYAAGDGGVFEIKGELKHTGTLAGFFNKTPVGQQASIADPSGGVTVDANARTAINSILDVLDILGFTV